MENNRYCIHSMTVDRRENEYSSVLPVKETRRQGRVAKLEQENLTRKTVVTATERCGAAWRMQTQAGWLAGIGGVTRSKCQQESLWQETYLSRRNGLMSPTISGVINLFTKTLILNHYPLDGEAWRTRKIECYQQIGEILNNSYFPYSQRIRYIVQEYLWIAIIMVNVYDFISPPNPFIIFLR